MRTKMTDIILPPAAREGAKLMSKDWTQEKAFEVLEGEITRLTAEKGGE